MNDAPWEDALEAVVAYLDAPPDPESPEGRAFDEALRRVLASAPSSARQPPSEADTAAVLDESLRARLDDLARRRTPARLCGVHSDGVGPTLGKDKA